MTFAMIPHHFGFMITTYYKIPNTTDSYRTNFILDHTQMRRMYVTSTYICHSFKLNVGIYSSPMGHLGYGMTFFRYFQL